MRTFAARCTVTMVGLGVLTSACTSSSPASQGGPSSTPTPSITVITPTRPVLECPVTAPSPLPASEPWAPQLFGSGSAYGNGQLWVGGLGPDGVIELRPENESSWKFGWWRVAQGKLRITGRRLDAAAAPLGSTVPDGYGELGFQSSGVYFPTPGCWEITGTVGPASLTCATRANA